LNIIQNILYNDSFPIRPHKPTIHTPAQQQVPQTPRYRWATFTYIGKETSYITNVFRQTDLRVAYRTNNTIKNLLMQKNLAPDQFSWSGAYKLTCPDCNKAYVGQTRRNFTIWYKKYKQAFRDNSHMSKFAKHLNKQAHSFSSINNIMQVLHYHKKASHLNTTEQFYIQAEYTTNNHLNYSHTIFPSAIFDTLLKTHRP